MWIKRIPVVYADINYINTHSDNVHIHTFWVYLLRMYVIAVCVLSSFPSSESYHIEEWLISYVASFALRRIVVVVFHPNRAMSIAEVLSVLLPAWLALIKPSSQNEPPIVMHQKVNLHMMKNTQTNKSTHNQKYNIRNRVTIYIVYVCSIDRKPASLFIFLSTHFFSRCPIAIFNDAVETDTALWTTTNDQHAQKPVRWIFCGFTIQAVFQRYPFRSNHAVGRCSNPILYVHLQVVTILLMQ